MLISVAIISYNQEKYIEQCLQSVLMQKHEGFDLEIVVADDASTDGTQSILEKIALKSECVKLILNKVNKGISENWKIALEQCNGKYITLLEGDDYWSCDEKLQRQVDFLETHNDYGFVGCYNTLLYPDGREQTDKYDYFPEPEREGDWEMYGDVFEYAKNGPVTRTVSLCFRRKLIEQYIHILGIGTDLVLQTILAKQSLFAKHSSAMCVYRQGGVSTDKLSLQKQLYYSDWYVQNRLLQKQLFPQDCNWNENELADRRTYILLTYAVKHFKIAEALDYKKQLLSPLYKRKTFSRYLYGYLSGFILCLLSKIIKQNEL